MESTAHQMNSLDWNQPDAQGHFGLFEGRYVPETLCTLKELEQEYFIGQEDPALSARTQLLPQGVCGATHPSLLCRTPDTTFWEVQKSISSAKDLLHTGAHKINNSMGQILLAKRMGKSALSRKQEPDSMGWPPLRWRRCLGWSASSTWVKSIASDRRSTFFG